MNSEFGRRYALYNIEDAQINPKSTCNSKTI